VQLAAVGLIIAALLAAVGLHFALDASRSRAWSGTARSLGLVYSSRESGLGTFGSFRACRVGEDHLRCHLWRGHIGPADVALAVLEHCEVVSNERRTWRHTACLIDSPQLSLAPFFARPQRVLDRLGTLLGGQDIGFPDDASFSQAYLLQGPEEKAIRARFDAASRLWFTERASQQLICEGSGRALLLVAPRGLAAREARQLLQTALDLAGRWSTP